MKLKDILGGVFQPAAEAFRSRNERKMAEKTLEAKIAEKRIDSDSQVTFNDQEWERLAAWANESTWKDEFITIVVLSPFILILVGGVLTAFGYPQVLDGVEIALMRMATLGLNLGRMIEVVAYAGVGVYGWRKMFS